MNQDLVEKIDERISMLKSERTRLLAARAALRGGAKTARSVERPERPRRPKGTTQRLPSYEDLHKQVLKGEEIVFSDSARRKTYTRTGGKKGQGWKRRYREIEKMRSRSEKRPRGAVQQAILDALQEAHPKALIVGEVVARTGVTPGSASTTLTKLVRTGRIEKAERGRGYRAREKG